MSVGGGVSWTGVVDVTLGTVRVRTMAADQQGFLQEFYQNLRAGDGVELEESGGMRLLVQQVMDGYGKGYAYDHDRRRASPARTTFPRRWRAGASTRRWSAVSSARYANGSSTGTSSAPKSRGGAMTEVRGERWCDPPPQPSPSRGEGA